MASTFDPTTTALAGVLLIPLVITLIQFAKQIVPDAPGNLWLGAALLFGVAGQVAAYIADHGVPSDFNGLLALCVWGLVTGLAAAKAYDETIRERPVTVSHSHNSNLSGTTGWRIDATEVPDTDPTSPGNKPFDYIALSNLPGGSTVRTPMDRFDNPIKSEEDGDSE